MSVHLTNKTLFISVILVLLLCGCNNQPPNDEISSTIEAVTPSVLEQDMITKTHIVFVTHGVASNPFWAVVKRGADQAANDFDLTVDYRSPASFDVELMAQKIETVITTPPDGLVVSIPDVGALSPAIEKAVEANIPIISINVGQETTVNLGVLTHVGQLEYEAGVQAGKRLVEAGVRHGFCVNQEVGNRAIDARCQGFTDAMIEVGGVADTLAVDNSDLMATQQRIGMALEAISTVDGILTGGGNVGMAALRALKEKNRLDNITLATFDLSPEIIEAIQSEEILFAVDQQQYLQGYLPVMLLHLYLNNGNVPVDDITPTGPNFVTLKNVDAVIEATEKVRAKTSTQTTEESTEPLHFVVITQGKGDSFWSIVEDGVNQAAQELGVTVEFLAPAGRIQYRPKSIQQNMGGTVKFLAPELADIQAMAQLIDEAVATKPDGLVVSIPDLETLVPSIETAIEAGIPVISINSGSEVTSSLGVLTHVGQLEYEAGFNSGKRLAIFGVRNGVCISNNQDSQTLRLRCEGFTDALERVNGTVETLIVDPDNLIDMEEQVVRAIKAQMGIVGVLTADMSIIMPTLEIIEGTERLSNKVKLATFDTSPEILTLIKNNDIIFAVDQQQYLQGYIPIVLLKLYNDNANIPADKIWPTGPRFVDFANVNQFLDDPQTDVTVTETMEMAEDSADVVTLEWWTVDSEEYSEQVQREMVEQFEAEHPHIKINMTVLSESNFTGYMETAFEAGDNGPDVAFFWDKSWFPEALDLAPFIEHDNFDTSMYLSGFWKTRALWDDKIVALPLGVGASIVLYNKDIFDEVGLPYPTEDWTTDDWLMLVTQLNDPAKKRWGGDRPRHPFRALWFNYGARPYSDNSLTVDSYLNSPESVAAYTWLWNLVQTDSTPSVADIEALGREATGPVDLFLDGRLAMATLNQGHMLSVQEAGLNFGVLPEPGLADAPHYVNSWSLPASIWKETKHPDEAWTFLKWWAGPPGQRFLMEHGTLFPSIKTVLIEHKNADEESTRAFFNVLDLTPIATWRNIHPCSSTVIETADEVWEKIMLDEIKQEQIQTELDALVPTAQKILDECRERLGG
ncbi:extracellular solute-binding protein [Anaerolineales bacterium HSG25]|nr:extracellular solute-binding protein [Anaerolineales bacterium HSG25]